MATIIAQSQPLQQSLKWNRESFISKALELAKEQELTRIEFTVREHNKPAIALYEKHGFVIEGMHKNAVRINNYYENNLFSFLYCFY